MLRSPQQQTPGAEGGGTPARAQARHPLDRPLPQRATGSALALLFSELVQRARDVAATGDEMEARLADAGEGVGERALEIAALRERGGRREPRLLGALSFVHGAVWRALFGRAADSLEKGDGAADEYMIVDEDHLMDRTVSVPKDMGQLSVSAFSAGIIRGALKAMGFPCTVTAHAVQRGGTRPASVFLIKFGEEVMAREGRLG